VEKNNRAVFEKFIMRNTMKDSIDLSYRPKSYFWADTMGVHLPSQIKGAQRKSLYEASVAQDEIDELNDFLAKPSLSSIERELVGKLHLSFLGGEFLPDKVKREVEIARITLNSTTRDVISFCVRPRKNGIFYRVIDEYDGECLNEKTTTVRKVPMTLGQMTDFFLQAWSLPETLEMNFGYRLFDSDFDLDDVRIFILEASSSFYSQFGKLVDLRVEEWLESKGALESKKV
jgi:hypothetical protein